MTYAKNRPIAASSLNSLLGVTNAAAPSAAAATNSAGYLWGVGFGDRGYGQPTPSITAQSTGGVVTQLTNFAQVLSNLASWQGSSTSLLPAQAQFAAGAEVEAFPSGQTPSVVDFLQLVDTNRMNYQVGNMTLTPSAATSTRSTTWGSGTGSIDCVFDVTFASEDAARFFFNTGGEIRIALAHPNTSSSQNTAWNNFLANSNFAFRVNDSVRISGSFGSATAVGYYDLTTAFQTIVNGSSGSASPYTSNTFLIEARAVAITGANGARGSALQFRITLTDGYTSAFVDSVASGTVATLSHLRAGLNLPSLPPAPTCAVSNSL